MAVLSQLRDPREYRASTWDLLTDDAGRRYWTGHFREHLHVLLELIAEEYPAASDAARTAFIAEYEAVFNRLEHAPETFPRVDVLLCDELRAELLTRYGFPDPFRGVKARENQAALRLLPALLSELDAMTPAEHRDALACGLLAGNIFDLGARATIELYRNGQAAFDRTRANLPARPWLYDDVARWWASWDGAAAPCCRHAVFFVDNAGSDIVLGCLPLVRALAAHGTSVTLAANTGPALNDVTAEELTPLLAQAAELDPLLSAALRDDRLRVRATGSRAPLLDLARLDDAFVSATRACDLVWLHGMGRAIESNFHAEFACAAVWTAVLKEELVAERIGGRLFDCVFRHASPAHGAAGQIGRLDQR